MRLDRWPGNLRLLDGDALLDLLMEHYEGLDARHRAEIPLERVYIPEPGEEANQPGKEDGNGRKPPAVSGGPRRGAPQFLGEHVRFPRASSTWSATTLPGV